LLADLRHIIDRGKSQAVAAVNSILTLTYWHVDKRINEEVLQGERAAYGLQVVDLVAEYWTELPPRELLEQKLHTALIEIQARLAERQLMD
jgi:hypothetical protein